MKGAIAFILAIFAVAVLLAVAPTVLNPIAETTNATVGQSNDIGATSTMGALKSVIYQWIPLVIMGGFGAYGLAYYVQKELTRGRR
jgi:hypothetical protein